MVVYSLYYYPIENIMVSEDGQVVYDIFYYITPNMYNLYKRHRGTYYIKDKHVSDLTYEMVFPLEGEEDNWYFNFESEECSDYE